MNGLVIGTVIENYDEKYPGMVQVSYPFFEAAEKVSAWMPVSSGYTGKNYGVYMLPEKDEQVVVGFIGGDEHSGIVLGSLWNTQNTIPPDVVDEKNSTRCLVTKGGHSIVFKDGDEGKITVKSKDGHTVEIDEKAKTIKVSASGGKHKLTLDEKNKTVDLESGDKLNIKAETISIKGAISLKGPSVTIESDNVLMMKGKQVKLDSSTIKVNGLNTEFTGANVKVESSGILTLKGSMTKIN